MTPTVVGVMLSNATDLLDRFGGAALEEATAVLAERLRAAVGADVEMATHPGGLVALVRPRPGSPALTPEDLDRDLAGFLTVRGRQVWPVVTAVLRDCTPGEDVGRALSRVRSAVLDAHGRTPGTTARYAGDRDTGAGERLALASDLAAALRDDPEQLGLAFQPVVDLASGAVIGAEALLRWQHPDRGPVPPSAAVDAAERSGLIHPLGRLVLDRALGQLARWRAAGRDLTMHVNVSPHQLRGSGLAGHVQDLLDEHDVPPSAVLLELTESALMGGDATIVAALEDLRVLGVRLGLDDFGTGYSSIAHLHELTVHTVKVDRSLVADIATSGASFDLLRAVVGLLEASAVGVVVEGVETAVQAAHARAIGCGAAQGYLFGRPGPARDFPGGDAADVPLVPRPRSSPARRTVA